MIGKNDQVVLVIQEFITSQREEKGIVNEIIREDVFDILGGECTVLYYALEDNRVEGCHVIKPVNGKMEQFVFINTTKAVQEQTWTAAHELGHVWKVDTYVKDKLNQYDLNSEHLVNRFAAELLLPKDIFIKEVNAKLDEYGYKGPKMSSEMMVRLVTYLMNYFCTPHKAIIRRFIELEYIDENAEGRFLKGFEEEKNLYERGINLFLQVMDDLDIEPIMHEFVAKVELEGNIYLQQLIDTDNISIVSYEDYLKEEDKSEYEQYFQLAFEQINLYDFPAGCDIYQYEDRGESLGEIRSLYMARKMGYIYFMSDDADARMLVKNFFSSKRTISVKTLFDTLVMCKEKNTALKWKDINPTVSNVMRGKSNQMNYLKNYIVNRAI